MSARRDAHHLEVMAEIHFCGEDDQPLCRGASGAWLWTLTPTAVTCLACSDRLGREPSLANGRDSGRPDVRPAPGRKAATRSGT
jgi:hypothetical protein